MTERRTTARPPRRRSARARAATVLQRLEAQQGRATWKPRYDPTSELVFTILSQHTSDLNAERAFLSLRERLPAWEQVAAADPESVVEAVSVAGLGNQKGPRIQAALHHIQGLRGDLDLTFLGGLPLDEAKAWLRAIPGVGPKTAAVVLAFALGMPALPVDTHVHRVTQRLGLIGRRVSADQAHDVLEALVPPRDVFSFHVALITHGRQVCKAQRPRCGECVLREECPSRDLQPKTAPGRGLRAKRPTA